jgi:uncharacterized membrane protein (UPF0127 family)
MVAAIPVLWAGACGGSASSTTDATVTANGSRIIFHSTSSGDSQTLDVEVAETPQERTRGLMNRTQLEPDRGMIFLWEAPVRNSFWMKDTNIPLSIAFISTEGIIVDFQDMQPLSEQPHQPPRSYIYAVEANQGWFSDHGIRTGDEAEFIEN